MNKTKHPCPLDQQNSGRLRETIDLIDTCPNREPLSINSDKFTGPVRDLIFFGNFPFCTILCYRLHERLERAFLLLSGMQQPPDPTEPPSSEHERACYDGQHEVHQIAEEIVKGLLGKDYVVSLSSADEKSEKNQ